MKGKEIVKITVRNVISKTFKIGGKLEETL